MWEQMILFSYILPTPVVEIGVVLNFFDAGNDFVQFGDGRHAGEARRW